MVVRLLLLQRLLEINFERSLGDRDVSTSYKHRERTYKYLKQNKRCLADCKFNKNLIKSRNSVVITMCKTSCPFVCAMGIKT